MSGITLNNVEEIIRDEQALQLAQKLYFFEELVNYIKNNGNDGIGIEQAISLRNSYRNEILKIFT
ncbi:hypothetical protein [Eubacterium sp.]|uniref:hypothetical protein n=1 Tax=Eubacterium sp. TaxID=142586 RepID=UPI002FC6D9F8